MDDPEERTEVDEAGRVRRRYRLVDGRLEGEHELFGERGQPLRRERFRAGRSDGEWKVWDARPADR